MTEQQYLDKCAELADSVAESIKAEALKMLKSGAVDLDSWNDDYVLPKIVITAILTYQAVYWFRPFHKDHLKDVRRLKFF